MASAKVIRTIIGIIGTVISSLISLSQLPRFIHIYKKKSVEDYIPTRHLALVIIHGLWVLYGLPLFHKDGILVTTSNGIGCLIEVIYLVVFLIYCSDESCRSNTWFTLASGIPLVLVLLYGTSLTGSASLSTLHITIGVICDVLTTGVDIKIAVTYEDVPVWFYLAKFINAGVWLAYSLFYQLDIFVLISSGLGMLLCASQLIFCSNQPSKATLGSDEESGCTPAVDVR